jgi:hypothetical protein
MPVLITGDTASILMIVVPDCVEFVWRIISDYTMIGIDACKLAIILIGVYHFFIIIYEIRFIVVWNVVMNTIIEIFYLIFYFIIVVIVYHYFLLSTSYFSCFH